MSSLNRLKNIFSNHTLPLLQKYGWDVERGGVIEQLYGNLHPANVHFRRSMLHARQLFLYSLWGAKLDSREYQTFADRIYEYLMDKFSDGTTGAWFDKVDLDGHPLDRGKSLYSHAFLILGVATYGYLQHRIDAQIVLDRALEFLESHFRISADEAIYHARLDEDNAPIRGPLLQNPHMHLFEALLQVYSLSKRQEVLEIATRLYGDVLRQFRKRELIVESIGTCHCPDNSDPLIVEPGHQAEWAWLIHWYCELSGTRDTLNIGRSLYRHALNIGWDTQWGGLYDEVDFESLAVRSKTKRLWPLLELLKATLVYRTTDADGGPTSEDLASLLLEKYMKPNGIWNERLTRELKPVDDTIPLSSGYHLGFSVYEAAKAQVFGRPEQLGR